MQHSDALMALLGEASDETFDALLEVGASWDEIAEAAALARYVDSSGLSPSSPFVAEVQRILSECGWHAGRA